MVAMGFAILALQWVNVSTHWSFTRMLDLDMAQGLWFVVAVFWGVTATLLVGLLAYIVALIALWSARPLDSRLCQE